MSRFAERYDPTGQGNFDLEVPPKPIAKKQVRFQFTPAEEGITGGVITAWAGDREVGYISYIRPPSERYKAEIQFIRVLPECRRWGLGEMLYQELLRVVRKNQPYIQTISGDVHTNAAFLARLKAYGKPARIMGDWKDYANTQESAMGAANDLPDIQEDADGSISTSDNIYLEHPVKRRQFYKAKTMAACALRKMAQDSDLNCRYAQADALDGTVSALNNAQNAPGVSMSLKNLANMIQKVDKHYALQIQELSKKVQEIAQQSGAVDPQNSEMTSENSSITVPPGSNVDINAENSASAEVNL